MHNYVITEFPEGDDYWFLSSVGPISINESGYRMEIDLVAIDYDQYERDPIYTRYVKRIDSYIKGPDKKVIQRKLIKSVGVEYLALIDIGSVWKNKKLVSIPLNNPNFRDLTIELHRAELCKVEPLKSIIDSPHRYHPFSVNHQESNCLVADSSFFTVGKSEHEITKILIPPSELIKFYYSGSSYLIKQLIGTGIQDGQLFIEKETTINDKTRLAGIVMRKGTYDTDSLIIGRIALSDVARQNAVDIGRNLRYSLFNGEKSFLKATFPFSGATTLSVKGKYLKLNETGKIRHAFLVYAISRCTAPFPFDKLLFDRDNNNQQNNNVLEEKQASPSSLRKPSNPEGDASITSSQAADLHLGNVVIPITIDARFGHLPPTERVQKEEQKVRIMGRMPIYTVQKELYSTSDEPPDETGVGPGTISTEKPIEDTGYGSLPRIVSCLQAENIDCLYLGLPGWIRSSTFLNSVFPYSRGNDQSIINWGLINSTRYKKEAKNRGRRLSIVKITRGGTGFYLIDCEARDSERFDRVILHTPGQMSLNDTILDKIILLLMNNKGVWSSCDLSLFDVVKKSFRHRTEDSISAIAARIILYLDRV